jgi:hypothetical protein
MKKDFITLLNELIEYNGKKILEQSDRFLGTFLDFTQNEYRAEAQVFSQFLASKQAQEIKASDDIDAVFLKAIADRFHQVSLIDTRYCELIVNTYASVLGLNEKKPEPKPEVVETSAGNTANASAVKASKPLPKNNTKFWLIAVVGIIVIAVAIGIGYSRYKPAQMSNNPVYIGFDDSDSMFGIIRNNKFQAYGFWENNRWDPWGPVFNLPDGYTRIFYWEDVGLGIVTDNRVKFYCAIDDDTWYALPSEYDFILPSGFNRQSIIFSYGYDIFITVNNRLHSYRYTYNDIWEMDIRYNFDIPLGYRYIFGNDIRDIGLVLGVVFNNRIMFYRWNEENNYWSQTIAGFDLPNGTRSVFGKTGGFGIVFDDRIEFYEYRDNNWLRRASADFLLR